MKHPKIETFEFDGDEYYQINKRYARGPTITACPEITWEKGRQYIASSRFSHNKHVRVRRTPRFARFWKIINYPFVQYGGPQVSIVGTYGEGKSVLMNLFIAFFIAKRLRVIMFNDHRFEARNLAMHGWFDKRNQFHPFVIDCFVPKGYEFDDANPLWDYRQNVHKVEWETIDDILQNTQKIGHLTVVYDECFDEVGKLKLWIDLMTALGRNIHPNINYLFTHHELSSLIPEVPTKNIYALTRKAANVALGLRKDRIGVMTTFHMQSEVFYRVSQKFGFIIQKRPVNRSSMSPLEKDARNYSKSECGVSIAGYWTKHHIEYFPEMPDAYRLLPQLDPITYPDFTEQHSHTDTSISVDPIDLAICQLRARGRSWRQVSADVGLSLQPTYERGKKLGLVS